MNVMELVNQFIFSSMIIFGVLSQIKNAPKRDHFVLRIIIAITLWVSLAFLMMLIENYTIYPNLFSTPGGFYILLLNIPYYLFSFFACLCIVLFVYRLSIEEFIISGIVAYTMQHLAYQMNNLCYLLTKQLYNVIPDYNIVNWINYGIYILCYIACFVPVYYLFIKKLKFKNFTLRIDSTLFLILFAGILVTIVMNTLRTVYSFYSQHLDNLLVIFGLFDCILILALLKTFIMNKKAIKNQSEMERYYQDQIKSYQIAKENIEAVNIKCHDLRKQIRLLTQQENQVDIEKLKEIQDSLRIYDNLFETGNPALNTVLSQESIYIHNNNITLTLMAKADALANFESVDVFTLFTNILDNAIEAVKNIPDVEKRIISLSIEEKQSFLKIDCRNLYEGTVLINKHGLPYHENMTRYHGNGTKSIANIVKKYHGKVDFSTDEGQFIVCILLPLE